MEASKALKASQSQDSVLDWPTSGTLRSVATLARARGGCLLAGCLLLVGTDQGEGLKNATVVVWLTALGKRFGEIKKGRLCQLGTLHRHCSSACSGVDLVGTRGGGKG